MGARGPKPKLPQIDRLDGIPNKAKPRAPEIGEFLTPKGQPFCPPHLEESAQACMEVVMASMPDGVYSIADTYTLAAFATAWAKHSEAAHKLQDPVEGGAVIIINGEPKISPWLRVLDKQAALMATLGDRLGLNPKARVGIQLPRERQASKFDGLRGQIGSSGLSKT
jgi:phage terminase small subunit